MILGKGANDTFFFSSDSNALVEETQDVIFLEDGDLVHIQNGQYSVRQE